MCWQILQQLSAKFQRLPSILQSTCLSKFPWVSLALTQQWFRDGWRSRTVHIQRFQMCTYGALMMDKQVLIQLRCEPRFAKSCCYLLARLRITPFNVQHCFYSVSDKGLQNQQDFQRPLHVFLTFSANRKSFQYERPSRCTFPVMSMDSFNISRYSSPQRVNPLLKKHCIRNEAFEPFRCYLCIDVFFKEACSRLYLN